MPRSFDNLKPTKGLASDKNIETKPKFVKREVDDKKQASDENIRTAAFTKNMEDVILHAAEEKKQLKLRYKKRTGEIKTYVVNPYSYRYKFSPRGGRQRMLFAYDVKDKHIKGFYVKNLLKVQKLSRTFRPIWPIEIY